MEWETRISPEANKGLRAIERGVAAQVTAKIRALAAMSDPAQAEGAVAVEESKADRHDHPAYEIEVHAHFVTFSVEKAERKIIRILEIE